MIKTICVFLLNKFKQNYGFFQPDVCNAVYNYIKEREKVIKLSEIVVR